MKLLSSLHFATTNDVWIVAVLPPELAVTVMGHVPSVVLEPTPHDHVTLPETSAIFGPRPASELGPSL